MIVSRVVDRILCPLGAFGLQLLGCIMFLHYVHGIQIVASETICTQRRVSSSYIKIHRHGASYSWCPSALSKDLSFDSMNFLQVVLYVLLFLICQEISTRFIVIVD